MKKIAIVIAILFANILFSQSTHAQDTYYQKGITYAGTSQTSSSTIVMSVAAMNSGGTKKDNVVVYSRCSIVENVYNADYCVIKSLKTTLYASNSSGTLVTNNSNMIGQVAPEQRYFESVLPDLSIFIPSYRWNLVYYAVQGIFNTGANATSIIHSNNSTYTSRSVTYNYPSANMLEVPSTIAYDRIPVYYSGKAKGVATNFLLHTGGSHFTAKAQLSYEMGRITGYYDVYRFNITSNEAKLIHSVGL